MKILMLFSTVLLFFACSKNTSDNAGASTLVGKWTLVETLADPGDGSGTWQPADTTNHYFIRFNADNSIESNLYFNINDFQKYNVVNDSSVIFIDANGNTSDYHYKIKEPYLTIMGGCYEACGSKFIRSSSTQ